MCSSRLWIWDACEKPAPCLWTDWVENSPGISGPSFSSAHRAVVLEQRMEGVVADPGLVPQHVVAQVPDLLEHLAHVVDRAVIGRELDARRAGTGAPPCAAAGPSPAGSLRICSRRYFSSQASQSTAPIMPKALRAVGRKIGIAPAWTRAPWWRDLWLLRSKRTRSPRRSTAFVTTLLDVLVPFSTK